MTMECVVKFDRIFISIDRPNVAFGWMKSHFPFSFRYSRFVEMLLHIFGIDSGFNSHLCNGFVCKQSYDITFIEIDQDLRLIGTHQKQRVHKLIFHLQLWRLEHCLLESFQSRNLLYSNPIVVGFMCPSSLVLPLLWLTLNEEFNKFKKNLKIPKG